MLKRGEAPERRFRVQHDPEPGGDRLLHGAGEFDNRRGGCPAMIDDGEAVVR